MITAVDTNILIDIVGDDPVHGRQSRAAFEQCAREGQLIVCAEVVAEFTTGCGSAKKARELLSELHGIYVDTGQHAAEMAGEVRSKSRLAKRITADYVIAAHAAAHADRLLTRDAGIGKLRVPGLTVLTPRAFLKSL